MEVMHPLILQRAGASVVCCCAIRVRYCTVHPKGVVSPAAACCLLPVLVLLYYSHAVWQCAWLILASRCNRLIQAIVRCAVV